MLLSITKRGIFERVTVILLFKFRIRSTSWSYRSSGVTGDKMLLNDEFLVMNYARQQKLITHNSNLIVLENSLFVSLQRLEVLSELLNSCNSWTTSTWESWVIKAIPKGVGTYLFGSFVSVPMTWALWRLFPFTMFSRYRRDDFNVFMRFSPVFSYKVS